VHFFGRANILTGLRRSRRIRRPTGSQRRRTCVVRADRAHRICISVDGACGRRSCVSTMQVMDAERRPANTRRPRRQRCAFGSSGSMPRQVLCVGARGGRGKSAAAKLVVGLTDQTLSCAAKAHVATAARHDTRLHVRRAMRVACRRSNTAERAGSAGGPKPGRASFYGELAGSLPSCRLDLVHIKRHVLVGSPSAQNDIRIFFSQRFSNGWR
jgi:hypothetical protein